MMGQWIGVYLIRKLSSIPFAALRTSVHSIRYAQDERLSSIVPKEASWQPK